MKKVVVYDKDSFDFLEMFQEYYNGLIPEFEVEDLDNEDDENASIWIVKRIHCHYSERLNEKILGAFLTEEDAENYLHQIKYRLNDDYKCYDSKYSLRAYLRDNRSTIFMYEIEKVDLLN